MKISNKGFQVYRNIIDVNKAYNNNNWNINYVLDKLQKDLFEFDYYAHRISNYSDVKTGGFSLHRDCFNFTNDNCSINPNFTILIYLDNCKINLIPYSHKLKSISHYDTIKIIQKDKFEIVNINSGDVLIL